MADGDLGAPVDSLEFENADITWSSLIHVTGDIYAISFTDAAGEGQIVTVAISDAGEIGAAIEDSFEFADGTGAHPSMVHVANDVFAIAYRGAGASGFVITLTISAAGVIAAVAGGLLEFEPDACYEPDMIKIPDGVNTFAIVCRGNANQGIINTLTITDAGAITAVEMKEAWGTNINGPHIIHVAGNYFAIVSRDNLWNGFVRTIVINAAGGINAAVTASVEFEAGFAADQHITWVRDNIYAIAYRGADDDGFVLTVTISVAGAIALVGGAAGLIEYDEASGVQPCILHLGTGTCVIAYAGTGLKGWLCSIQIDLAGQITILDSLEFDASTGQYCSMVNIAENQYAVAYRGTFSDGFICTPTVETPVAAEDQYLMMMGIG